MLQQLRIWLMRLIACGDTVLMNADFTAPVAIYLRDGQVLLEHGDRYNFHSSGKAPLDIQRTRRAW